MSVSEDLIDFSIIEAHKENIQALPSGRSARTLAALYSPTPSTPLTPLAPSTTPTLSDAQTLNDAIRREYDAEVSLIAESDDPLDVYDRYVKWTLNAYPSAQATKESQLLPLLERATKTFLNSAQYKNDPRYLKLWLLFIKFFTDAPRETFAFLSRHGIGESLALFYEEFAAWLEGADRWRQAEEIYNLGMEKNAAPLPRLMRKFAEFQARRAAKGDVSNQPSSPALPASRPALAAKIDPFAAVSSSPADPQASRPSSSSRSGTSKSAKSKLTIFSDGDESRPAAVTGGKDVKGWDSIGSLADRRKENVIEPKPWAGETLKTRGKKSSAPKMAVFKDESLPIPLNPQAVVPAKEQVTINPKNGRREHVFVNLEAVYPTPDDLGTELSFEELRAGYRGWLDKKWQREVPKLSLSKKVAGDRIQVFVDPEALESTSSSAFVEPFKAKQNESSPKRQQIFSGSEDVLTASTHHPSDLDHDLSPKRLQVFADIEDVDPASSPIHSEPLRNIENESSPSRLQVFSDPEEVEPALHSPSAEPLEIVRNESLPNKIQIFSGPEEFEPISSHTYTESLQHPQSGAMLDENGAVKESGREGRNRRFKTMEVNETQIIKTKLSSPSAGKKLKRKVSAEPTMTFHTKAATDEIYDIFNQPLKSEVEEEEEEESEDDDYETDGEYTSGGESTGTGRLATTSEAGDDDVSDGRSVGEWTEFTARKHIPELDNEEEVHSSNPGPGDDNNDKEPLVFIDTGVDLLHEEMVTPISPEHELPSARTMYIPIPPEDYVGSTRPYRDASQISQNRLPFMTPIAEKTESSLGASTYRGEKDYFSSKTPSKENAPSVSALRAVEEGFSSPFREIVNEAQIPKKISQPVLSRSKSVPLTTSAVKESTSKGPVIQDMQCNPVDSSIRSAILSNLNPPLSASDGFFDHNSTTSSRTSEIKKFAKAVTKLGKNSNERTTTTIAVPPVLRFPGSERQYTVKRELGAGAFAPVYLIENQAEDGDAENDENGMPVAKMGKGSFDYRQRRRLEALKMEDPPSAWEFYIMRIAKRRLGVSRAADSITDVYEMHLYADECFLIESYRDQGTLLDVVNIARTDSGNPSGVLDESLAMFFSIELFRTIEALHAKGLLHGDLKADNCLVRLDTLSEGDWSARYSSDGTSGWSSKGISLIDFGRGIDMRAFRSDVQFIADWKTGPQDCAEMRELRPWTWQIDYHGLAGIVHSLLFGKYIDTAAVVDRNEVHQQKTWRIRESLKRYWQTQIWSEVFDLLLNPAAHVADEEGQKMPVLRGMRNVREKMELWLAENCERGVGLKTLLMRLEYALQARKK